MSEEDFRNSYVCPECFCADGWRYVESKEILECLHCHNLVQLSSIMEYNKTNSGWFRLE